MFIVVQHDITNKDAFLGAADRVTKDAPSGIKPIQFLPSTDSKKAVCLWEAQSVEAVKGFLEPKIGTSSTNTYYAIDSKAAMGLPTSV